MTASSGWNQSPCPRKKNKFGWRFGWKTPAPRAVPRPDSTGTRCSAGRISCFVGPWSSRSSKSAPPAAPDADEKRRENSRETVALAVRIHRHRSPLLLLPRSLSLPLFFLSPEIPSPPPLSSLSFFLLSSILPSLGFFARLLSILDFFLFRQGPGPKATISRARLSDSFFSCSTCWTARSYADKILRNFNAKEKNFRYDDEIYYRLRVKGN